MSEVVEERGGVIGYVERNDYMTGMITMLTEGDGDLDFAIEKHKEGYTWQRLAMENERMKLKMSDEYMKAKSDKSEYQKAMEEQESLDRRINRFTTNNSGPFTSGSVAMLRPGENWMVQASTTNGILNLSRPLLREYPADVNFQKKQDRSKTLHKLRFRQRRK